MPDPSAPTSPRRFRFGLRTLFVLVTVVAMVLAAYRAFPELAFHVTIVLASMIVWWVVALSIALAAAYLVKSLFMVVRSIAQRFAHRD